ncbi:MAG TPA: CRISPR-associated endonuclease Cas2 [Agitococcus sp.]|nr:CRISPR-associated endonuclease Cas2 [Agitococcus sp.]HMV60555.1 CRISPR-associated endonuclease Cas2 [Agitococcus sp.]HMX98794.1 CRISPR-associated endonuclease Cas2 [Agitococcus sp.]HNA20506.1 CRISPR-associated endonuclease Cas2 [Agitococcus sp.]HNC86782.1 CRISPR-associated endonuclease Cas2 [Agitococcus sp.]
MAKEANAYTVAYDLSNDKERQQVNKLLKGFGFTVQKSVFECHLTRYAHSKLLKVLTELKLSSGHVRIYRVYSHCAVIGVSKPDPDDDYIYFV